MSDLGDAPFAQPQAANQAEDAPFAQAPKAEPPAAPAPPFGPRQSTYDDLGLVIANDAHHGLMEAAAHVVTGFVGGFPAYLGGGIGGLFNYHVLGKQEEYPSETAARIAGDFTYEPKSEKGKQYSEIAMYPLTKLAEWGAAARDAILEAATAPIPPGMEASRALKTFREDAPAVAAGTEATIGMVGATAGFKAVGASPAMAKYLGGKIQEIYRKTGKTPEDVLKAAAANPTVMQDIVAENKGVPDDLAARQQAPEAPAETTAKEGEKAPAVRAAPVQDIAAERIQALEAKAAGTPTQTIKGPEGTDATIPGRDPTPLTEAESTELSFLKANQDKPENLVAGYGLAPELGVPRPAEGATGGDQAPGGQPEPAPQIAAIAALPREAQPEAIGKLVEERLLAGGQEPELASANAAIVKSWYDTLGRRFPGTTPAEEFAKLPMDIRHLTDHEAFQESLAQGASPAKHVLRELSKVDDLFRYPKTGERELPQIVEKIDPTLSVHELSSMDVGSFYGAKVDRVMEIRGAGANLAEMVQTKDGNLWLNIAGWAKGERGASVYAAAFDYARNNGLKFIGDPNGLSDTALRRRTEQMLSSALKYGTTEHMEPHARQLEGDEKLGVQPLTWATGEHEANIRSLLQATYDNLKAHVPEIEKLDYDLAQRAFVDRESGQRLPQDAFDLAATSASGAREAQAGSSTLKRAILAGALLRDAGGEGSGVLGEILRQQREQLDPALQGLYYQNGPKAAAPFYSELARQVDKIDMRQAPAQGWKDWLKSLPAKGVKPDEIKWTGLEDWLDLQEGRVTKEQVQEFLKNNGVKVEVRQLGIRWPEEQTREYSRRRDEITDLRDHGGQISHDEATRRLNALDTEFGPSDTFEIGDPARGVPTKFRQYTLPGGKNYRERLLTLPVDQTAEARARSKRGDELRARWDDLANQDPSQARDTAMRNTEAQIRLVEKQTEPKAAFQSSHFDEKNILAHERVDDREIPAESIKDSHPELYARLLAEGRDTARVRFTEEIQSDWAQKGRKEGFKDDPRQAKLRRQHEEIMDETMRLAQPALDAMKKLREIRNSPLDNAADRALNEIQKQEREGKDWRSDYKIKNEDDYQAVKRYIDALRKEDEFEAEILKEGNVPAAPFVGKTDAWATLTLKSAIRDAVDGGYDLMAWTTGEQQVQRYSSALRHAVDEIHWKKTPEGVQITGYKGAGTDHKQLSPDRLARLNELEQMEAHAEQRNVGFPDHLQAELDGLLARQGGGHPPIETMAREIRASIVEPRTRRGDIAARYFMPNTWGLRWGDGSVSWYDNRALVEGEIDRQWSIDNNLEVQRREKVVDTTQREDELSDAIGKAMADQIRNDPNQEGVISGKDITVSDTGMAGFYDRILPKLAGKVLKQLGGGKVGEIGLDQPSTTASLPEFKPMSKTDREVFAGADDFKDGSPPMIGHARMMIDGKPQDVSVIISPNGLEMVDASGELAIRFPGPELSTTWEDSPTNAVEELNKHWQDPTSEYWQSADVIVGEAESVQPANESRSIQHAFEITPAMREAALKGQPLFQEGAGAQPRRAQIAFGNGAAVIDLFKGADASSFMHEFAHYGLNQYRDIAGREGAPPEIAEDWAKITQWLGIPDLKPGDAIPTAAHEQWAQGWEQYLREGKAPEPALQGVFEQFKQWLVGIYQHVKDLGIPINEDIRGVMDRMLGSDKATELENANLGPGTSGEKWTSLPSTAPEIQALLRNMADQEAGWAVIGGRLQNASEEGTGRPSFTPWVPKAEWWTGRPDKTMNEAKVKAAVDKALEGKPLRAIEQRLVDYLTQTANERLAAVKDVGGQEAWDQVAQAVKDAEMEPTTQNVVDADAVARATAKDPEAVERAAITSENDDVAFMAAIKGILNETQVLGQSGRPAAAGGEGGAGAAPDGADSGGGGTPQSAVLERISFEPGKRRAYTWGKFYADVKDELWPIQQLVKMITGGADLEPAKDPYKLARLTRGSFGKAEQFLEFSPFNFKTYENVGKALREIIRPVENDLDGLRAYMVARRTIELEAREITTGVPIDAAKAVVDQGGKYAPIFDEIKAYQDHLVTYLRDSGVLGEDQIKAMREANKDYVPFFRLMDDAEGGSGAGSGISTHNPVKKIRGSERKIIDPLESIVKNTYLYTTLAERNAVGRALLDLVNETGRKELMEKVNAPIKPIDVQTQEVQKFMDEHGIEGDAESFTIFRRGSLVPAPDEIAVYTDGKREVYRVPEEVAAAFKATDRETAGMLTRVLAIPAKVLRVGATLSPDFMARNPVRDQFSAYILSKNGYVPILDFARGVVAIAKHGDDFQDWLKSGGANAALVSMDRQYVQQELARHAGGMDFAAKAWNIIKNPLEPLRIVSELMENATRLGEFMKATGGSRTKEAIQAAGYDSREVTLDFSRIGAKTRAMNMVTAFWNANIEGIDRVVRGFNERPLETGTAIAAAITLPSVLLWWANHDDPRYKEVPNWERDLFWIVMTKDHIYRIPKPFELGVVFGSSVERLLDAYFSDRPEAFKDFSQSLSNVLGVNMVPTAAAPVLGQIVNWNFFTDRPLIPGALEKLLPEYQYANYTTEATKALAHIIGSAPGMHDVSMASPMVIDNYIRSWTGTLGDYAWQIADKALREGGVLPNPVQPTATLSDMPVIRGFVVRYPSASAQSIQDFQDSYRKSQKVFDTIQYLAKQGNTNAVLREMRMDPQSLFRLQGIHEGLAKSQQVLQMVNQNQKFSPDEKRQLIDSIYMQMIQMAHAGNDTLAAMKKAIGNDAFTKLEATSQVPETVH